MPDQKRNVKAIFDQAVEIESPHERDSYLDKACGDDIDIRNKVDALLAAYEQASSFLESSPPGLDPTQLQPVAERPGMMIGAYKLMEQIGEGGMGVVYVADQRQPVRRKVALKIIKPGMDTKEVIARFEAERQALALMEHPNIAKVFDAGSTESGRPYFVMELVRGIPITDYCDQNKLTTSERLELFVTVCHAVKHAHQKGIIHRDVKPSNIMVTLHDGTPVPKIIDFGVAKAINQQLTERTIYTQYAQMVGTPLYMSPEQAELSGIDVDTRTDIYSLGVLLYELLTGTTPFEKERVRAAAYDEIRRIIREEEPPKPSTRISTLGQTATAISTHRKTDPKHLSQLIRGDLDWIVMKALEKDRTRRYETVGELAADVRRHFRHEPIVAGPPSVIYKLRKFSRRNKAAIATVGLVAAALVLGLVVSTWQAVRATNAKVVAKQEKDRAAIDRDRAVEAEQSARQERDRAETARRESLEAAEQEAEARRVADEARREAERYLHVMRMNLAGQALKDANVARTAELLELCRPRAGQRDAREFTWYYLWRLCQPDAMTLRHGAEVWKVAWSPDGKLLAAAGLNSTVKLWDAATGSLLATLRHDATALAVAFSPDGKTLATGAAAEGGQPPQLKLWNIETHAPVASFRGHLGGEIIYSVVFSPDGKVLASSAGDSTVRLWDVETGQPIASFQCDQSDPLAIAFSPDGALLAVGGGAIDRGIPELKLWNTTTRQLQAALDGHEYLVSGVAFSPDGKILASGGADRSIILWDVGTAEMKGMLSGHQGVVKDLAFTSDGVTLASASFDRTVRLWDTATGYELRRVPCHMGQARCVAFSPDDRWLLTGGGDGVVRIWDAAVDAARDTLRGHEGPVYGVAFSPDGKRLVSGGEDDTVRVWDVETAELRATFSGPESGYELVAFSPDGRTVAATGDGGTISLLDVSTGRERVPLQVDSGFAFSGVCFSPDGATVTAAGSDAEGGTIILWDTATGRQRRALRGHDAYARSVCFSPDGQTLASGSHDNTIKLWEPATGQLLGTLDGHTDAIYDVRFSPDGRTLASASLDESVRLWDVTSGEVQATLTGHAADVRSVAFSPDGKTLASAGSDATVKLWQVGSGEELATLVGHEGPIWKLAFSPDGRTLASTSLDGTVRLWRAATEEEVLLKDRVRSIATADGGQQRQTTSDLREFLAMKGGKGLRLAHVSLVMSAARAFEEAGNHELAASAYRGLAEAIANSQDETLSRVAENWEGLARRLALVGNEIELEGSLADGGALDWSTYQGKVVLAAFWPTWCNSAELSVLRKNYELYRDRGFDVVVFDTGSDRQSLQDYLEQQPIEWTVVSAEKEKPEQLSAIYGVAQIPTSILIDGQGHVVSLDARGRQLDELLEQLLGPPFSSQGELSYIDLQPKTNWKLTEGTPDNADNTLEELPQREQVFGGVRFKISDAVIQLGGPKRPDLPVKVEGIVANRAFSGLYLLHSTQFGGVQGVEDGMVIGKYVIHYEDNSAEEIPIVYGEDVRDWWNFDASKPVTRGLVVWEGENQAVKKLDQTLRLYLSRWKNPHPHKKVVSIDYISTNESAAAPFCVAMTAEVGR